MKLVVVVILNFAGFMMSLLPDNTGESGLGYRPGYGTVYRIGVITL